MSARERLCEIIGRELGPVLVARIMRAVLQDGLEVLDAAEVERLRLAERMVDMLAAADNPRDVFDSGPIWDLFDTYRAARKP